MRLSPVLTPRASVFVLIIATVLAAALVFTAAGVRSQPSNSSGDKEPNLAYRVVGTGELPDQPPTLGRPRDPLSADEVGYAIHQATTDASIPTSATDVLGAAGPEVLLTDLPAEIIAGERIAVVHLYDYTANVGHQQTVNLKDGTVRSAQAPRLQGPISAAETEVAVRLAIEHEPRLAFVDEFEAAQGVPLLSPDQLVSVAGTFVHDGSTAKGGECGADRCAQLMVRAPTGAFLDTWGFVVNLSDKTIVDLGVQTH